MLADQFAANVKMNFWHENDFKFNFEKKKKNQPFRLSTCSFCYRDHGNQVGLVKFFYGKWRKNLCFRVQNICQFFFLDTICSCIQSSTLIEHSISFGAWICFFFHSLFNALHSILHVKYKISHLKSFLSTTSSTC